MANQPKNYKKFVATAATATLVASAIVPVASAASFSDIEGNTHADAIKALSDAGIIKGYEDGTFKPNAEISRGQTVKLLGRWLETKGYKVPGNWNTVQRFNDLPVNAADQELVKYAALVKDAGVFNGSNGNLNYSQPMQRQQMALVLVRAIKTVEGIDLIKEYKDAGYTSKIKDLDKAYSTENVEAITALEYAKITVLEDNIFNPTNAITRGQFASFLNRTINYEAPVKEAKVVSVSAINAKELVVKFSQPVKKADVIDSTSDTLKDGVFDITEVDTANPVDVADNLKASLSEDGKTLTIIADTYFDGKYAFTLKKDTVETVDGKKVPAYSTVVSVSDTERPYIKSVYYTDKAHAVIEFSEPMQDLTSDATVTVSFERVDGVAFNAATVLDKTKVTKDANDDRKWVVDLSAVNSTDQDKDIKVTIIGAKDAKGNLITPNPVTTTVKYSNADSAKAEVSSITVTGERSFDIKFSKALAVKPVVKVGGTTVGSANIEIDSKDKSVVHVKLTNTEFATAPTGLQTVEISAYQGLNLIVGDTVSKVVNFTVDTTKPEVVSAVVQKIDGVEYLVVTYNEDVTIPTYSTETITGTRVKDYVTTSVTITPKNTDTAVANEAYVSLHGVDSSATKSKAIKIKLNNVADGNYNVTLPAGLVADVYGNKSATKTNIVFTRTSDSVSNTPTASVTQGANPNKVVVTFTTPSAKIDPVSALDKSNYYIEGATIESVALTSNTVGTATVELTLAKDSNTFTGLHVVTVKGVKSEFGVVMDTYTANVSLNENVRPTVKEAVLSDTNKIKVTFSEAVSNVDDASGPDFELYVGGTKVSDATLTAEVVAVGSEKATLELTLTGYTLTPTDISKGLSIQATDTINIKDAKSNDANVTSVPVKIN